MANDFSTIKLNQSSEKFYLIRIEPRRYINDDLSSIGGGQYQADFTFPISKVEANGVELTKVTSVSSPGEYSYDETTDELIVYSTPSSSNAIVVTYLIFYAGGRNRVVSEDPENTSTTLRDWLPRIDENPIITASIDQVINGFLSVASSNLTIINDENEFNSYTTDNDSFNKATIKIWLGLNDSENLQKIFDGKIINVTLNNNRVNIKLDDPLSLLNEPCTMGDLPSEIYFQKSYFPNMNSNQNGLPIRYIIGNASRYKTISESVTNLNDAQRLDPKTLYEAVCVNFSSTPTTSNNREYGICRVNEDGFLDFSFTPSNIDNSDPNYTRLDGTAGETGAFTVGDTFIANQASTDYYVRVLYVDRTNNYVYVTKEASISTGATIQGNNCPSLIVSDDFGNDFYLLYGRDYTADALTTTNGGNKYLSITLVNNFESNHPGLTLLNPNQYFLKYKVRPNTTNHIHGDVVQTLIEKAGLTINSASITSANSAFDGDCCFSIPYFDQNDYTSYLQYLQNILKSTFGYISLNNDFEIEYDLFAQPSSTDNVDNVDILKDTYSVSINYRDIITQIIAFNPHCSSFEAIEDSSNTPSITVESEKSKYLHGIERASRFRHVLQKINGRIDKILNVRTERQANYSLSTKLINIDSIIGDDINLIRNDLLGGVANKNLKIISIEKSPKDTRMILTDLLDIGV